VPAVLGGRRAGQPLPHLGALRAEPLAGVPDDQLVEVEAPEVVDAVDGPHVVAVGAPDHQTGVEGAAAEVVHQDAVAGGEPLAGDGREVPCRGDRLRDQGRGAEPSGLRGLQQDQPPRDAPGRRVAEHHVGRRPTDHPRRLLADPRQHGGDERRHRVLDVAEQHGAVVDAPLRSRLEPRRLQPRGVHGVPADQQGTEPGGRRLGRTSGLGMLGGIGGTGRIAGRGRGLPRLGTHGGRQQRGPVEQQRPDPAVRPRDDANGV
jgi:hypothetical protein